jgi:hypothetical protein
MGTPTKHKRGVVGFQRQACVVCFERCDIDQRARPVLSGFNLAGGD